MFLLLESLLERLGSQLWHVAVFPEEQRAENSLEGTSQGNGDQAKPQALSRGLALISVLGSLLTILGSWGCLLAPEMSGHRAAFTSSKSSPQPAFALPRKSTLPLVLSPEWMGGQWQGQGHVRLGRMSGVGRGHNFLSRSHLPRDTRMLGCTTAGMIRLQ